MKQISLLIVSLFFLLSGVASASDSEVTKVTKPDYLEEQDFQKIMSWSDDQFDSFYWMVVSEDSDIVYVNGLFEKAQKLGDDWGVGKSERLKEYVNSLGKKRIDDWRNKMAILDDLSTMRSQQGVDYYEPSFVFKRESADNLKEWVSGWVKGFTQSNKSDAEKIMDINQSKAFFTPVVAQFFVIAATVLWILGCMITRNTIRVMSFVEAVWLISLSGLVLCVSFYLESLDFFVVSRALSESGGLIVMSLLAISGLIFALFMYSMRRDQSWNEGGNLIRFVVFMCALIPSLGTTIPLGFNVCFGYDFLSPRFLTIVRDMLNVNSLLLILSIGVAMLNVKWSYEEKAKY